MTPFEAARFMMSRNADPDLIAAYLLEEARRAGHTDPLRLSPHPIDRGQLVWGDLSRACAALGERLRQLFLEDEDQSDYALQA